MIKHLLCFFLFISLGSYAHDTIYYNSEWSEVQLMEDASFYSVLEFEKEGSERAVKRDYYISGVIRSEKHFSDYEENELDGTLREWWENGSPKLVTEYKKGRKDGYLVTYWENGQMKRSDRFKKGELVNGICWNEAGEEIPYFNYLIPPEFPGGMNALKLYLKKNSLFPLNVKEKGTFRVEVRFKVSKTGKPVEIEVEKGDQRFHWAAIRMLEEMPTWEPGKVDGELVKVHYLLPLVFVK